MKLIYHGYRIDCETFRGYKYSSDSYEDREEAELIFKKKGREDDMHKIALVEINLYEETLVEQTNKK